MAPIRRTASRHTFISRHATAMSRSTKDASAAERFGTRMPVGHRGTQDPTDEKAGAKRRTVRGYRKDAPGIALTIWKRTAHGSTAKILRRNRRLWERLAAKLGRRADREEIAQQLQS
jgi:hypothetical protein